MCHNHKPVNYGYIIDWYWYLYVWLKRKKPKKIIKAKENEIDRRNKSDRRSFATQTLFPLKDSGGKINSKDRCSTPDRRISNIQVKEHHVYSTKYQVKNS